ncbi:MAG: 16S rRNA (guanine(966)-N(2))-methyltransferase RsmD [Gammaproteobacteria bacterium]|nr:16S rRNA (guanine(966)-N(2))-methyltransferase RsmD [Gammaproteobacteria bacterium]
MSTTNTRRRGMLRIIGGEWRSRILNFDTASGVRPTTDRVRETLFNWLQPATPSAKCLDLFSGSGALGIEALSRGAHSVTFVERSNRLSEELRDRINLLDAQDRGHVIQSDAESYLQRSDKQFDIVFLDPPFSTDIIDDVCATLEQRKLLADNAYIYIETPRSGEPPVLPSNWAVNRAKIAGQVSYQLAQRHD